MKPSMHAWLKALAASVALFCAATAWARFPEADKHIAMAQTTLSNFLRDPTLTWFQEPSR